MIWLIIGIGIYLAIGVFILVIFAMNSISLRDIGVLRALAVFFGWLPKTLDNQLIMHGLHG